MGHLAASAGGPLAALGVTVSQHISRTGSVRNRAARHRAAFPARLAGKGLDLHSHQPACRGADLRRRANNDAVASILATL
jgi:hypothetical protein